jgi:hypothetical protein
MTNEEIATIQAPEVVHLHPASHALPQGGRFLCRYKCNHKVWLVMEGVMECAGGKILSGVCCTQGFVLKP